MIKKLLLVLFALGAGAALYMYMNNVPVSVVATPIQRGFTRIQSVVPKERLSLLFGVGSLALTGFFAWTKNRAMQKIEQTKQLASQQLGGLNKQVAARDAEITALKSQLETAKDTTGLQSSLAEAQNLVTQKQEEIKLLRARYQGQIDALHEQIAREKLKVHKVTVVK